LLESTDSEHEKEETDDSKSHPKLEHDLLIAEYNSLVAEKSQRMGIKYQVIGLVLVALGTILGIKDTNLLLLFPILSLFLLLMYTGDDIDTKKIEFFIRNHVESEVGKKDFGWETYRDKNKTEFSGGVVYSANRIFFVTCDIVAFFGGLAILLQGTFNLFELILVVISIIFTILAGIVAFFPSQLYEYLQSKLSKSDQKQRGRT
jgi:hypothetical protein